MKDMWVVSYRPAGCLKFENHEFWDKQTAYDTLRQWLHNWSGEGTVTRVVLNDRRHVL